MLSDLANTKLKLPTAAYCILFEIGVAVIVVSLTALCLKGFYFCAGDECVEYSGGNGFLPMFCVKHRSLCCSLFSVCF